MPNLRLDGPRCSRESVNGVFRLLNDALGRVSGLAREFERRHFVFAATNQRVGSATRDLFASWGPRLLAPAVRYGIYAVLDDDMLRAFGFPRPLPFTRPFLHAALRLRGRFVRLLPPRSEAHFFTDERNRTHPSGYRIDELGPRRLIEGERRRESAIHPEA